MAIFKIEIPYPDEKAEGLIEAICFSSYQPQIRNPNYNNIEWLDKLNSADPNPNYDPRLTIPNPLTKEEHAQMVADKMVEKWLKDLYTKWKMATDTSYQL
jgi:hypothetical protein